MLDEGKVRFLTRHSDLSLSASPRLCTEGAGEGGLEEPERDASDVLLAAALSLVRKFILVMYVAASYKPPIDKT